MSALLDALTHPANRPRPLVEWLALQINPSADLRGLEDGGGQICDFRPGLEEKDPSLSVSVGSGGAVFKRFGGDSAGVGAVDFVALTLNVTKGEAARLLIERAGLVDTTPTGRPQPTVKAKAGAAKLLDRLGKLSPLEDSEAVRRLRGWVKIKAGEDTPEHVEVAGRGLTPALPSGVLTARRFTGKYGQEGGPQKTVSLPGHILPGAVAFEVPGPDGKTWAVKVRNPGSKEDLEAAKAQRYAYLGKGQSTPAWCSPGTLEAVGHLIVEGELNGVACAVMLEAAGYGGTVAVQGVASAEALPHVSHIEAGADVWLYADPDTAGDKARQTWAGLLSHLGAKVYQIGQGGGLFPGPVMTDACDALGTVGQGQTPDTWASYLGARLMQAMQEAPLWVPPQAEQEDGSPGEGEDGDVWLSKRTGYGVRDGKLCALTLKKDEDTGEEYESREVLAEFTAHIVSEVSQEDGTGEAPRVFEIEGTRPDGRPMRPARVKVTAADFAAMNWPVKEWGAGAVVHAGQGKKDKARVAIQMLSTRQGIEERTVYQHTGWIQHAEHGPVYLTAGAVIGAAGAVQGVDVELSSRLAAYALPDPAGSGEGEDVRAAVRASLALLNLAPDPVAVPVLGAVYRAPLGRADFVVWPVGETGRNKTAFLGPVQAHYGAGWNREYLPDGWNSTANALESAAFRVKDAPFLIDDFKPSGGQGEAAKAYATVARILQGVADGAGRATLTADRKQRAGLYPRGLVMTSSETLPRGHSNRARAVFVDVTRPLIGKDEAMSRAYYAAEDRAAAGVYALATAAYLQTIAGSFEAVKVGSPAHRARVRELAPRFEGAHGRTGKAAAELAYGWEVFLSFAVKVGAVSQGEAEALWARVVPGLEDTAKGQAAHLTAEDPVTRALGVLSGLLGQGRVFLEDRKHGGEPAHKPELYGWEYHARVGRDGEDLSEWRPRPGAVRVGWHEKDGGDEWAYFLPDGLHEALQRAVGGQGGAALPDAGTLWANMRDRYHPAGAMRCEAVRKDGKVTGWRPMHKATAYGVAGQVRFITLRLPLDPDLSSDGISGINGIDGEERTSDTAFSPIPLTLFFKEENGINGIDAPSSFAVPPALPDPLEALEGEEWRVSV